MASSKGKEIVWEESYGKRKRDDKDKFGDNAKRKNRGVLQFFDDAACEVDDDEDSDEDDFLKDFLEDEFQGKDNVLSEPGKASHAPVLPKEEEISEEEFDRMLEERYKPGSGLVTYAEDAYESSSLNQGNTFMLSTDPTIWKVKCMVGRERSSAFCLMQKYVDLHSLGTKLQIISACALDHVKGFIYIEAEKQGDLNEACKGICTIYPSRVAPVSKNEVSHLFTVRSKNNEISVGTWARVKNGKYRGDLAQVMAVDEARKKATVKLIPRVDLQALAEKYGGGISLRKKTANPAPKLISSTELEEFRPLIQYRRDRDIGQTFEVLDGLMLKDGYLFKKVPIDSLNFWGVMPSEDELLKFEPSSTVEEPDCQEFLTELYGEPKKKPSIKSNKGGGKGEGSSSSGPSNSFEVHDLVLFNKKEFGVVVGSEKDDYFKVLKEGSEGPVAVTVEQRQLKNASFDKKLTALDHRKKTVSINDTVKVLEGPLQGREGIVKQVYRGIVFLCDEREQENSGYVCCKSQICEKVKLSDGACKGKGDESSAADFGDPMSSPKSPLSPKKPWQMRENNNKFNREGKDGMFSVGQSLRIRVGPLKGYLCRVLAVRRSDITVKLDSQHKILTVKQEHLSEVRGKSSAVSIGNDGESAKPFDFLGTQDSSGDWMAGAGTSADGERSGAAERTPWPTFSSSAFSRQPGSSSAQAGNSNDTNKDAGDAAWDSKMTSNQNTTSWGAAAGSSEQAGGWGKSEDIQKKPVADTGASDGWGKAVAEPKQTGGWGSMGRSSDQPTAEGSGWKKASTEEGSQSKTWGNAGNDGGTTGTASGGSNWGKPDSGTSWNKQGAGSSRDNQAGGSWGKPAGESTWAKPTANAGSSDAAASTWGRIDNGSSEQSGGWKKSEESFDKSKNDGENGSSTWGKASESVKKGIEGSSHSWGSPAKKWGNTDAPGNSKPSWNASSAEPKNQAGGWGNAGKNLEQPNAGGSGWKKASNEDGGQTKSWGNTKKDVAETGGATSWGEQDSGTWNKQAGGSSWGKPAGGSSWTKPTDGSTGSEPDKNDSWQKAAEKSTKDDTGGKKAAWNSSSSGAEAQTGGWGNGGGSGKQDGGSSWKSPAGGSSWNNKQTDGSAGGDSWGKPSGGGRGGWNQNKMGNKDDEDQQGWDSGKSFDGGRGSGGRRGRGGREQFGRGGSFGRGQSSDWNKDDQGFGGGSRPSWGKPDNSEDKDNGGGGSWGSGAQKWGSGDGSGGGFGGRGGYGGRGDRGGFGGRGDRGGFGGRGDRGGFQGRGDRGSFQGRGDRGGFRGRGDFGGRGRGRRDQNDGDWNSRNDSGEGWKSSNGGGSWGNDGGNKGGSWGNDGSNKASSWGNDGDNKVGSGSSGWKASTDGGGGGGNTWGKSNEGDGGSGGWKQSNTADGGQSSGGWNQRKEAAASRWGNDGDKKVGSGSSGWKASAGGGGGNTWGKSNEGDGGSGGWKQSNTADGSQSSGGWNQPKEAAASRWGNDGDNKAGSGSSGWKASAGGGAGNSWGKSNEGNGGSGGWKQSNTADGGRSSGGWNQPKEASAPKETPAVANTSSWGKSSDGGGQSSGWNQSKEPPTENAGAADPWGKASSWGKGNGGGSSGGGGGGGKGGW